ncbi:MAG: hypothetical protein HQK88_01895 [Nitrospirae bacterium]|nr:hypothetical protein [Nitrospirota bacterium]MBF0533742.1 hypothetical protein [Nitrospirota bacterium]MBF0615549.1 hypothetical protein [Nitrospirota bacterium]
MQHITKANFFDSAKNGKIILFFIAFAVFSLITVLRRVDVLLHPQFWAEDGFIWYSDAYASSNSLQPFLVPVQRYLQTLNRVGAYVSMFFDIKYAPLIFNIIAITVQIFPAMFFTSERFEQVVSKYYQRFLLGIVYLTLPGAFETHANLTNGQWRLALLMFLIVIASTSKKIWWRIVDCVVLLLAGLSGPLVFFVFPLALFQSYLKSFKTSISHLIVLAGAFLLQVYSFIFIVNPGALRSTATLGAGVSTFIKILAGKVLMTGTFGVRTYDVVMNWHMWQSGTLPVIIATLGICLTGYAFWRGTLELKLLMSLSILIFASMLVTPQVSDVQPQWTVMLGADAGNRYFLFPVLAWVIALIWLFVKAQNKFLKNTAGVLLVCMVLVGIPKDFFIMPYENYHFQKQVIEFKKLSPGQKYTFLINPAGWRMTLIRK